jgi:myxalamid-type polyketide synthase MxaB
MAADRSVQTRLRTQGFGVLETATAHEALAESIESGASQLVVLQASWNLLARSRQGERVRSILSTLDARPEHPRESAELPEMLQEAPANERLSLLIQYVGEQVRKVLSLASAPDPRGSFSDLGMDSLMAVELRNCIQRSVGESLWVPSTLAFDHPSVVAISQLLFEQLLPDDSGRPPKVTQQSMQGSEPSPLSLDPDIEESELDAALWEKINLHTESRE